MRPNNNNDGLKRQDGWNQIDDLGYSHHVITWMVILELEKEGVHPINTPTTQRRIFRWTGKYPDKDRVNRSIRRLHEHGLIDRNEVEEWPHGKHNTTTPDGLEIARQIALTWLRLLGCETREEIRKQGCDALEGGDTSNPDATDD